MQKNTKQQINCSSNWVFFDGYDFIEDLTTPPIPRKTINNLPISEQEIKVKIIDFLLQDRMENYGYDYKSWNRLKAQRSKAKAILKLADIKKLNWLELGNGFQVNKETKELRYIVFQSRNEEVTNIIRRLVGLKGWIC